MSDNEIRFGDHVPDSVNTKRQQSPAAIFTRGLQAPGNQWKFSFANGYGASVINDGYGAEDGCYELAVLGPDGHITYDTHITDDVLGWLTQEQVAETLDKIARLPKVEVSA